MTDEARPPLLLTVPLQATYFCGMVDRDVWENVPLTIDSYDGGGSLTFSMPVRRRWQLDDVDGGPIRWPGDAERHQPAQEQFFNMLALTLSPARLTLVWGGDDEVVVLTSWDEAFMDTSARHAAAALHWDEQRVRHRNIQLEHTPRAYLVQRFDAGLCGAEQLERAFNQWNDEAAETKYDTEEFEGEDDDPCRLAYRAYHTFYQQAYVTDDPYQPYEEDDEFIVWRDRAHYAIWQHLCWLRSSYDQPHMIQYEGRMLDRATCRALLRGPVRHDAADGIPAWKYDVTLATEVHNLTLLQLHALGLQSGRAAPLEYFRFIGADKPLLDVAANRTRLHHAARVIQRAMRLAADSSFAVARQGAARGARRARRAEPNYSEWEEWDE